MFKAYAGNMRTAGFIRKLTFFTGILIKCPAGSPRKISRELREKNSNRMDRIKSLIYNGFF